MDKHPSQMDKRTKEYKDWAAAKQAAAKVAETAPVAIQEEPALKGSVKAEVEEKRPSRPWERSAAVKRPWRRDYFALERRRPGFRPRFVDPTKVEGRLQRGYVVASPEHYGGLVDVDIRDSGGLGKHITRHGMVLMEIPEEGAQAYERQNEEFIQQQRRNIREELKKEAKEAGMEVDVKEVGLG